MTDHWRLTLPHWKGFLIFLIGPAFVGAISVLAWWMFGGVLRAPQRIEMVIPTGTSERVAAGEAVPSIPAKSRFVVGDVLVFRNDDAANHQIGPFWIPAGTTVTVPLEQVSTFSYLCTVHPSGYIGLEVQSRDSLLRTLFPTLVLGVPLGGLLAFVIRLVSRLDTA
jgi:hypothetical protein